MQQFSLLSLRDAATQISDARENNKVVNYGVDDTVKAAGNKRFDIKGAHIIITSEDKSRESFSTGFNINTSHSGVESAKTVQYDIAKLAVLTGNTYESMIDMVDYFMPVRATDNDRMLDELNIAETKRLKCNAHIVLAVDAALEKVFRDTEAVIGTPCLITEGAAHVFTSSSNSIWYLGLIALAKLVSPSHNKDSISLYKDYTDFLKENVTLCNERKDVSAALLKNGLKGIISNRFGRLGYLSKAVVEHKEMLQMFFDRQVDIHATKLVTAVDAYLRSFWFLQCSTTACIFYIEVILPIKIVIGLDEFKELKGDRSWSSMKSEFNRILEKLVGMQAKSGETGSQLLKIKCASEVHIAIKRQISNMSFFSESGENAKGVLTGAVITNCGNEGEFAYADNDLRKTGGAVSIQTISNSHIIARNKLFSKERWETLNKMEKRTQWICARNSQETQKVRETISESN